MLSVAGGALPVAEEEQLCIHNVRRQLMQVLLRFYDNYSIMRFRLDYFVSPVHLIQILLVMRFLDNIINIYTTTNNN